MPTTTTIIDYTSAIFPSLHGKKNRSESHFCKRKSLPNFASIKRSKKSEIHTSHQSNKPHIRYFPSIAPIPRILLIALLELNDHFTTGIAVVHKAILPIML